MQEPKGKPAGEPLAEGEFREACIARVRLSLGGRPIVKQSRATYASPDGSLAVVALVSREYENPGSLGYWYGLRVHQKQWLDKIAESYVAFGCGSEQTVLLVPLADLAAWLPGLHTTEREGTLYWHVRIERDGNSFTLSGKEGVPKRDISKYLLPAEHRAAQQSRANFALVHPDKEHGYIGVGVRSQNYYAGFGHIVYLNRDGSIVMCQPAETSEGFVNIQLREPHPIELDDDHLFELTFSESTLNIRVDDCSSAFAVADMPKVLGPGFIRFQSHVCWMGISRIGLSATQVP